MQGQICTVMVRDAVVSSDGQSWETNIVFLPLIFHQKQRCFIPNIAKFLYAGISREPLAAG